MPADTPSATDDLLSPAHSIPTDDPSAGLRSEMALCLSGGGYRAMLFHVGALWRLNEVGFLPKLKRVSSVSGGSITAGVLGLRWSSLKFDTNGVAQAFDAEIVEPVRRMAGKTIDAGAVVKGVLLPGSVSDRVAGAYRKYLFGDATLQDLPSDDHGPRFVINATNVQSGALFRFSRPYAGDWKVGLIRNPRLALATAVTASSAFPPVLSPVSIDFDPADFTSESGSTLESDEYRDEVVLTDGGVYDNLGLETVWKKYGTVFVSDGGGRFDPDPDPDHDWVRHSHRVLSIIDSQVRSLRKRQVIGSYKQGIRKGAYWGIWTSADEYMLPDAIPCPPAKTLKLAQTPTRLQRLDAVAQERLINWGYAACDCSLRANYDSTLPKGSFPYTGAGVG